jgi:hypothetical protein
MMILLFILTFMDYSGMLKFINFFHPVKSFMFQSILLITENNDRVKQNVGEQ